MAHDSQKVASALNGLTDRAFVDALSPRDQDSMHQLIADFFCNDPETDISDKEEEETGKYHLNINRTTRKQWLLLLYMYSYEHLACLCSR